MTTQDIINQKLDELESALTSQQHISSPETVGELLDVLSVLFHLMNDDDRDYVQCARVALENKIEWRV
jgi:DNA-binding ferritin-like protein (Dps family)